MDASNAAWYVAWLAEDIVVQADRSDAKNDCDVHRQLWEQALQG